MHIVYHANCRGCDTHVKYIDVSERDRWTTDHHATTNHLIVTCAVWT